MVAEFYYFGDVLDDLETSQLQHEESRQVLAACLQNPAFEVLELRRIELYSQGKVERLVEGIVVEVCDGTVPSRNSVGIKNRERLLLLYDPDSDILHDVRALRVNFPITPHQNHVRQGEPTSLCLYFESWSAVQRTWTAAKHLQRILWWLRETSLGALHRSDQPLERLYFVPPYHIVLPADFNEHVAIQSEVLRLAFVGSKSHGSVLRGSFESRTASKVSSEDPGLDSLLVAVPPTVVTQIQKHPSTLGELHEQLVAGGSNFLDCLKDSLQTLVPEGQWLPIKNTEGLDFVLLLLQVPVTRNSGAEPERTDVTGFIIHSTNLPGLGLSCGAFFDGKDGKAYVEHSPIAMAPGVASPVIDAWKDFVLEPVDVRMAFNPADARKASGVNHEGAVFEGVIAGLGALGSCLAELWCRSGWGHWTYVDDDILFPHNLVRHTARDWQIGLPKVDAVAWMANRTWTTCPKPKAVSAKATNLKNVQVQNAISDAQLLIDATTTLEVPRDLSDLDTSPRMASAFFTPSGRDSVLLMEDSLRKVRLHSIEAQYYRAVLNSASWGDSHLNGHNGAYWVGGGCRDLSGVLSQEVVQLHGATLARQIRLLSAKPEAQIRVWSSNDETGNLTCEVVQVAEVIEVKIGHWRIFWDKGLVEKLQCIRVACLPQETGGVILGYADQKRKAIHIVDVMSAPSDSCSGQASFTRGVSGVREALERAATLTANIVGYLGEWHSHPRFSSAIPSSTDVDLLAHLAETLALDGLPALMIIVGETELSISLGNGDAT